MPLFRKIQSPISYNYLCQLNIMDKDDPLPQKNTIKRETPCIPGFISYELFGTGIPLRGGIMAQLFNSNRLHSSFIN